MLPAYAAGGWAQEAVAPPGRILALDDVTRIALANSPRLARAEAKVEQARGQVTQAGLYPNPRYDGGNPQQLGGSQTLYNTGITQPVVTGGKIPLDVAIARRALIQAEYRLAAATLRNVDRRAAAILRLAWRRKSRLAILENLRVISQKSLDISKQLLAGEERPETDVLLLRVQLSRIEVNEANMRTLVEAGRRSLASAIGVPDLQIARASGDLAMSLPEFQEEEAQDRLLVVNSALLAARTEVARNQIRLRRAEVAWIPDVECQGGYQWTVMPTRNQVIVGTYFDVPLWNRNQGNILASSAKVRGSEAQSMAEWPTICSGELSAAMGRYMASRKMVNKALERARSPRRPPLG